MCMNNLSAWIIFSQAWSYILCVVKSYLHCYVKDYWPTATSHGRWPLTPPTSYRRPPTRQSWGFGSHWKGPHAAPWPWPCYSFFLHRVIQTRHRRSLSEQLFAHRHQVRSGSTFESDVPALPHFASAPCLFRIQWMPVNRHVESEKNWRLRMLSRMIREPWLTRRQQTWFMKPSISANSTINIQCNKLCNTKYQTAESIWLIAIGVGNKRRAD